MRTWVIVMPFAGLVAACPLAVREEIFWLISWTPPRERTSESSRCDFAQNEPKPSEVHCSAPCQMLNYCWPHHQLSHLSEIYTINTPHTARFHHIPPSTLTSAGSNGTECPNKTKPRTLSRSNTIKLNASENLWSEINLMQILFPLFSSQGLSSRESKQKARRRRNRRGAMCIFFNPQQLVPPSERLIVLCLPWQIFSMFPCLP